MQRACEYYTIRHAADAEKRAKSEKQVKESVRESERVQQITGMSFVRAPEQFCCCWAQKQVYAATNTTTINKKGGRSESDDVRC